MKMNTSDYFSNSVLKRLRAVYLCGMDDCPTPIQQPPSSDPKQSNSNENAILQDFVLYRFIKEVVEGISAVLLHCILHELYLTNHKSSLEHAICKTSCLLLAFLSPKTCHLSSLRSLKLILYLYPLSCSLSSYVGALYRSPWPFLNITH